MDAVGIEQALVAAEDALAGGSGLEGTGFWKAVGQVKRAPELAERFGARIATIDEQAFRRWALLVVPFGLGTSLAVLATMVGLALIGLAYALTGVAAIVAFLAGLGVLYAATHGLAHLVVGRALGIRFRSWFVGTITRPQPGVKIDYETYLRASPEARAWMHASGAIVSKLLPFALIGAAVAADLPAWVAWLLAVLGLGSVLTDVLWSTKTSDWKRFRREMSLAQSD